MKRLLLQISLGIGLLAIISQPPSAQWVQTNWPLGAPWVRTGLVSVGITSIVASGGNIFAGKWEGGVFLSTDNGISWTAVSNGLPTSTVHSLAASGGNIFAGTVSSGVFRSTDNGVSWTAVNNGLAGYSHIYINTIVINGSNIFAGTGPITVGANGGGVFLSTNNGEIWTPVNIGLSDSTIPINTLVMNGNDIFAGTGGGGVLLSTDNGTSWTAVNSGLTDTDINSLNIRGSNIFAHTGSGVFLSTNNGTNWNEANSGLTDLTTYSAVSGSNIIAGGNSVFLSTNNGTSWTEIDFGLPPGHTTGLIALDNKFFIGWMTYESSDVYCWTSGNIQPVNFSVKSLAMNGNNIFAGTDKGVFLSSDNGANWTASNAGLSENAKVNSFVVIADDIFAGTDVGVFLSTDKGANWKNLISSDYHVTSLLETKGNIFAGTWGAGVFLSTNNGKNWVSVSSKGTGNKASYYSLYPRGGAGYVSYVSNLPISSLAMNGDTIIAGTLGYGVISECTGPFSTDMYWVYDNDGNSGPKNWNVNSIVVIDNNIFAGTDSGMFLSTNNGTSWSAANTGLPAVSKVTFLKVIGSTIIAGIGKGVFLSTNNATSWTAVNTGLSEDTITAFVVSGSNAFAGTLTTGVWRRSLSEMIPTPTAPVLSSPSNGATEIAVNPTLTWSASDQATSYTVQISTHFDFTSNTASQSGPSLSCTINGLNNGTVYFWHVSATNAVGTGGQLHHNMRSADPGISRTIGKRYRHVG
jgi:photosystem II stability/assembly factor-like uncharacterized protein